MKIRIAIICAFLTVATVVQAEPIVLFDNGKTVPTYRYKQILQGISIPDFGKIWATDKADEVDASNDPKDPANWLPVTTTKLSPGTVKARQVRFDQLVSPVCIIGSDDRSLNWVKKYQSVLLKNNVLCWLVSAESLSEVQQVVTALSGVSMSPANGDEIAKFFSIKHYPVLITQRFIEQ
ncbi:MAG: integrating conjugative element protein [Gammaproteobacteria bacterium]|nr:integrating conjugative element protein [Gammaproteobacteria bacterium]